MARRTKSTSETPAAAAPNAQTVKAEPRSEAQDAHQGVERRFATASGPIKHDGDLLSEGDPVFVTKTQFDQLRKARAIVERDWDEATKIES